MDPDDNDDYGGIPPQPIKITAMNDGDDFLPPIPPHDHDGYANEDEEDDDTEIDRLPDFANDKAKELHFDIKQHTERLEKINADLLETRSRFGVIEEHLKNVNQEVRHTTDLVNSKKKEIETEDHLTQLVVREAGRYQQEARRLHEANELGDEKLNMVQNSIFKGNEKMDQFKLEMNWNQEELEQWALAARQKEDDNLALQKYTRADEAKIKETTLLMEKLQLEVLEAKLKVEQETTETQARQMELDRTAEEFREVHAERQHLVKQWQDTIEAMRARDATIRESAMAYVEERKRHAETLSVLKVHREHLEKLAVDKVELEARIVSLERGVGKRREDLLAAQAKLQEFTDELDVLKTELQASASALMRRRNENAAAAKLLDERKQALASARHAYQETKKALDDEAAATVRTELSAKEAERKMAESDAELKRRDAQVAAMKDNVFKQSQALFLLRQEEANMISETSGAQASSRVLQGKIRLLDTESTRQQQLIYNAEFQIQQMERKVSRGLGERSDEETKGLKKEIAAVEAELEAAKEQRKMLQGQCRKLNFELRASQRKKEVAEKGGTDLQSKIDELELEGVSFAQSLETANRQKEDAMVQNDVLRLETKRLRDALNGKADKVYSLENRKQQLALSMEERKQEIAVHQEVQRAQLRAAEDERHRVTVELGGRRMAVEKLRDKYEVLCKVSGVRGEEGGEMKSQAYYMIQAAQKREEMQRHGDELDQDIRKAEKEVKALTHTLKHLAGQNTDLRSAHQKVELTGEDAERLRMLEEQSKVASEQLFKKKKELSRLQTDLEEDGRRLEQVVAQAKRLDERNGHLESARRQLESELEAQRDAVDKVTRRVARLSASHRERLGVDDETIAERDFRGEALMDTVTNSLFTLGQLAKEYPEMKDALMVALQEARLNIPAQPAISTDDRPLTARSEGTFQ